MAEHGIPTRSDEHVQGAAEFVEERRGDDDGHVAQALAAYIETAGLDRPAPRGGMSEAYRAIVQRIRGRRLVEDLGEHEFSVEWLGFHIPDGAKGQLKLSSSRTLGYGVKLGVFGLGFGSGCRRTFAVNEDFRERAHCLTLGWRVRARLRSFADPGSSRPNYIQVDVLALLAEERSSKDPCRECSIEEEACELEQVEPALDLRGDPVGQVYERAVKLIGESEMEFAIPLSFSGLELKPSVSLKRSTQLECSVKYDLPGGFCYTPFERADGWKSLPIWRRS